MPDNSESKVKKLEPRPAAEPEPAPSRDGPLARFARHRFALRIVVVAVILAIALFIGGREIYHRINYVYAYDSRIDAADE